jgi:hypothetical protein
LQKRGGGVDQGVGHEFKLQYCKKKKKIESENYSLIHGWIRMDVVLARMKTLISLYISIRALV